MNLNKSILTCLAKTAVFDGRATRSEFWWFYAAATIILTVILYLDDTGYIYLIASLLLGLGSISAGSRRLHDIGKSGWWQLLWITLIGGILVLIWQASKSSPISNEYGDPCYNG